MLKPVISTLAILAVSASLAATAPIALAQQSGKPAATPDKSMPEMMAEMKGMMANCNQMMERMSKMMEGMQTMPMSPPAK